MGCEQGVCFDYFCALTLFLSKIVYLVKLHSLTIPSRMKITSLSVLFSVLVSFLISNTGIAQNVNNKDIVGKWVFADFSYKSAEHPEQDYTLSRKDFENMVKFKRTMEITADRQIHEQYGDMHIYYVYQIEGGQVYYWIPATLGGRTVLDEVVRTSTKTAIYKLSFENGRMVWMRQNSAYILKLKLQKQ